jgi:hypothetical protein
MNWITFIWTMNAASRRKQGVSTPSGSASCRLLDLLADLLREIFRIACRDRPLSNRTA